MLRRKPLQQGKATKNVTKIEAYTQPLGVRVKDVRESFLEKEVLGVGDNVIEALPPISETKTRKRKRPNQERDIVKKWVDSDDENGPEFEATTPDWAKRFDDDKSEDSDEEVLKAHSHYSTAPSLSLPSASLEFKRVTDANKEEPSKASIRSVEFHPKATAILIGGPDQTVRVFAIDGTNNRKIHSIFLDKFPVFCSHFSRAGDEIIMGSKFKSFYVYDMEGNNGVTFRPKIKGLEVSTLSKFVISPDGRFIAFLGSFGYIHLFSQTSKELIDSVKMNGEVKSISFSKDGRWMYSFGGFGEVYVWDMDVRQCVHHFNDKGCMDATCVAVSPDDNWLVTGSKSGIVNIYERETVMESRDPKPLKLLKNLTTSCSGVLFNSNSEILALRSKNTAKGIRLVHLPSLTVLPNFPDQFDKDLRLLLCMDFSPSSGYLALGNNKGRCLLYRLQHYSQY